MGKVFITLTVNDLLLQSTAIASSMSHLWKEGSKSSAFQKQLQCNTSHEVVSDEKGLWVLLAIKLALEICSALFLIYLFFACVCFCVCFWFEEQGRKNNLRTITGVISNLHVLAACFRGSLLKFAVFGGIVW